MKSLRNTFPKVRPSTLKSIKLLCTLRGIILHCRIRYKMDRIISSLKGAISVDIVGPLLVDETLVLIFLTAFVRKGGDKDNFWLRPSHSPSPLIEQKHSKNMINFSMMHRLTNKLCALVKSYIDIKRINIYIVIYCVLCTLYK